MEEVKIINKSLRPTNVIVSALLFAHSERKK